MEDCREDGAYPQRHWGARPGHHQLTLHSRDVKLLQLNPGKPEWPGQRWAEMERPAQLLWSLLQGTGGLALLQS